MDAPVGEVGEVSEAEGHDHLRAVRWQHEHLADAQQRLQPAAREAREAEDSRRRHEPGAAAALGRLLKDGEEAPPLVVEVDGRVVLNVPAHRRLGARQEAAARLVAVERAAVHAARRAALGRVLLDQIAAERRRIDGRLGLAHEFVVAAARDEGRGEW